ncbi:circularly permutated Ras protein 1 [Nerophis lumbriciformis]|uniref:circularly permutated Ras protein 1 n=1 Tax=Nerophis lumbriciformis TaxID=546530 RepID=UPI002ADFE64A|nr:circularly permutated Ras protein 1-like [Nerophis lumbriciformis]XP_061823552.1 circularly permutated Ras protein 1-like [Nerophis lumbriciformis]
MEFASDFVYVPPMPIPKDSQRPNANIIKRSALLPPINWVRPQSPPPPPPVNAAEVKVAELLPSPNRITEQKKAGKSFFYDNVQCEDKRLISVSPQQTTAPPKTALLPPHLRSPSTSPPPSRVFYDNVGSSSWEAENTHSTPEANATTSSPPPLPPRPSFMRYIPEYVLVLPASTASEKELQPPPLVTPPPASADDKGPLLGNPNVVLVSLGKFLSEEVQHTPGKPASCCQCGAVLDSRSDTPAEVNGCYFCQASELSSTSRSQQSIDATGLRHGLFVLIPDSKLLSASQPLLIFCIDISASMSITSQVFPGEHRSRLEFVQEAVLLCVQKLCEEQPQTPVGLISFNYQVEVHGYGDFRSRILSGEELVDHNYLKVAATAFPTPPPLSQTQDFLQKQVTALAAVGTTALGPAALLAITMASRHPGSKVIICTDGKANTMLGNLEVEDNDARTLLSSTIFYQDLGEFAANQGVTVSVLSIEGTDCRLDELGRLADRTGGKVLTASPNMLHSQFEQIIENCTIATHCTVTLLLPKSLRVKGEKEAGHKAARKVGNVHLDTEITFQFVTNEEDASAPPSGGRVSIQLQLRYIQRDGQSMLRVFTMDRDVTNESMPVLSSLSLPIIQLNSSQASAALAVRGRFVDARRESEQQMKLIERAIEHNRSSEDRKTYQEWVNTMEPIYNNIHNFTRARSVISDSQSLTDAGAVLLYTMKHSNRKTIMIKNKQDLEPTYSIHFSPNWQQSKY